MRVVVMAAWKGQNGQLMMGMYVPPHQSYPSTYTYRHDFNTTLGEGKTFPNWDDIKHHWDLPQERPEEATTYFNAMGRQLTSNPNHS